MVTNLSRAEFVEKYTDFVRNADEKLIGEVIKVKGELIIFHNLLFDTLTTLSYEEFKNYSSSGRNGMCSAVMDLMNSETLINMDFAIEQYKKLFNQGGILSPELSLGDVLSIFDSHGLVISNSQQNIEVLITIIKYTEKLLIDFPNLIEGNDFKAFLELGYLICEKKKYIEENDNPNFKKIYQDIS